MFHRSSRLFMSVIALCTTATAIAADDDAAPKDLSGWGRVLDPSRDCEMSLDVERDRLRITVPGTPHVLSAEDASLPMNAPRVVRRVRGDFTAVVRVLGRFDPGRSKTTYYDPYHGAGLIVWQDPSNYLRLERAVGFVNGRPHPYLNYELRMGGRLAIRASRHRAITAQGSRPDEVIRIPFLSLQEPEVAWPLPPVPRKFVVPTTCRGAAAPGQARGSPNPPPEKNIQTSAHQ